MRKVKAFWNLVIALVIVATVASCARGGSRQGFSLSDDGQPQMTDSQWSDSAYRAWTAISHYFFENEKDSFIQALPPVQHLCREHEVWHLYYITWTKKITLMTWACDFNEATKEAKAMFDDATARKNAFGLAEAYSMMAKIYVDQDNLEEAAKNYAKAVDNYPDDVKPGELINILFYYCQTLEKQEDQPTLDAVLDKWEKILERYPVVEGDEDADVYANWRVQYLFNRFNALKNRGRTDQAARLIDSLYYYEHIDGDIPRNLTLIAKAEVELALAQKDYTTALERNRHYERMSAELDDVIGLIQTSLNEAQAMSGLGRYREAYEAMAKAKEKNDSLIMADNREELNELNKRFELNELRAQQEREQLEAQRQRLVLYFTIGVLVLASVIVVIVMRLRAMRRLAAISAQKERMESELRIASEIQMSMVPSTFPESQGLDIYASMTPAREVGGDLYDCLIIDDYLYFCVGDVSGKGIPASLFMAQTARLFRALAKQGMTPADICTRMNAELTDVNDNAMFVTMFIGRLDMQTGHLDYCNAGHNPPVIGGGTQHGDFLEMEANAPIGLWPGLEYEGEELDSVKGRPLFIYTDGLNEAENTRQEQFGNDRLLSILRDTHFDSARQVVETLAEEVAKHRNGAEPNDDLTMMCLRVEVK